MTRNLFISLTVIAALTLAAAVASYYNTRTVISDVAAGEALFPQLADEQEDVARVRIVQGADEITIERGDDGWGIAERGGFRANADEVRETIVGLTQMEIYEAKTANPERYALLELGDPEAEDADSKLIELQDDEGVTIASVVLGKVKYGLLGPGRNGIYVRKVGDDQTWLATGNISAPVTVRNWAEKSVIDIPMEEITRALISHSDGDTLEIVRDEGDVLTFSLPALPDGATLKDDADLPFQMRSLGQLELWDVTASDTPIDTDTMTETTIDLETASGLNVTMHLLSDGEEEHWVSAFAWGSPEVQARIDEINRLARGWRFKVQDYKADTYTKRLADLIETPGTDSGS